MVTNRTFERAAGWRTSWAATPCRSSGSAQAALPWPTWSSAPPAATDPISTRRWSHEALRERRGRRRCSSSTCAVPRDDRPRASTRWTTSTCTTSTTSSGVVAENRGARAARRRGPRPSSTEEVESFWELAPALDAVPTIVALRDKLEAIRQGELRAAPGHAWAGRSAPSATRSSDDPRHRQQDAAPPVDGAPPPPGRPGSRLPRGGALAVSTSEVTSPATTRRVTRDRPRFASARAGARWRARRRDGCASGWSARIPALAVELVVITTSGRPPVVRAAGAGRWQGPLRQGAGAGACRPDGSTAPCTP